MPILSTNNFLGDIMVKGVNKNIIEIKNPDSLYFEKAVLYVRPNVTVFPEAVKQKETERIIRSLLTDTYPQKSKTLKKVISLMLLALIPVVILLLLR